MKKTTLLLLTLLLLLVFAFVSLPAFLLALEVVCVAFWLILILTQKKPKASKE